MDQLSAMYVQMACGMESQLHHPEATVNFVSQLQQMIEKSSAPRKNFSLDMTTPHGDVVITETSAMKPGIGWITLQVTEGIRRGIHEWGIKIENQGETTDGSGLMLGIVPKNFSKFDSFISQGGGWCLSRAGKFYGHWRRLEGSAGSLTFTTGDRVTFLLDYEASRMTVRVGDKFVVGELSNLNTEVFPAISLHYRHQFIRFEYHIIHGRSTKQANWVERQAYSFPPTAILPLSVAQMERLSLNSYVYSPIFTNDMPKRAEARCQPPGEVLTTPAEEQEEIDEAGGLSIGNRITYGSREAAMARLMVLFRAFASVRRYTEVFPLRSRFLSPKVTPEHLRKRYYESQRTTGGVSMSVSPILGIGGTDDAVLNCGAMLVTHMFARTAAANDGGMAVPLVRGLTQYLLTLPLFSLAETSTNRSRGSAVSPEIAQLAVDNIMNLLETEVSMIKEQNPRLSALGAALLDLLVLFALQRGSVSETLCACRYLLSASEGYVSPEVARWITENGNTLHPPKEPPNIAAALKVVCEDPDNILPIQMESKQTVLSVGYGNGVIYTHSAAGLDKWGFSSSRYLQLCHTKEPANCCLNAFHSSLAPTLTGVLLLTDRMHSEGIAVVTFNITLEVQRIFSLDEMGPQWPRDQHAHPLLCSGASDLILLVYENHTALDRNSASTPAHGAAVASANSASAAVRTTSANTCVKAEVEVQGFYFPTFPQCMLTTTLHAPSPGRFSYSYCISLRKRGVVDLGSPDACLQVPGGHMTVELWVMLLDKEDAATLYQHGDRSTSGEIFLETAKLEGAFCVRGGYRHDARGSCTVSAPLPPTAETHFFYIALVFDGRWRLYFDGEEVAGNKQGPHVSLDSPKQRWTVGSGCTGLFAGLRVWRTGRAAREVSRDYKRSLPEDEPGLVCQLIFNECSGNVVFNYVASPLARHAVCVGSFSHVKCDAHPWKAFSTSLADMAPLHSAVTIWQSLARSSCFVMDKMLALVTSVDESAPFSLNGGRLFTFFELGSGAAYPSLFYLTNKSAAKGLMGCDAKGRLWELFDMDAGLGGSTAPSFATGSASASREKVISVVQLPLQQDGVSSQLDVQLSPTMCDLRHELLNCDNTFASMDSGSNFGFPGDASVSMGGSRVAPTQATGELSYNSLGVWLLGVLAQYTDEEPGDVGMLFSPMADDVSKRCVGEIKTLLFDHFRVVRRSNARRTVALKCKHSGAAMAAAFRVLLRLIHRVRAYGVHPSSVGLTVFTSMNNSDDISAVLRELYSPAVRSRAGVGVYQEAVNYKGCDEVCASGGRTLMGFLGDIINESGTTLPSSLGYLARAVLSEGIELFIPSVRCRAKLLREMLASFATRSPQTPSHSPDAVFSTPDRVPAEEVFLNSVVCSLSTVLSAAPLIYPISATAQVRGASGVSEMGLDELLDTLGALMKESLLQLRSQITAVTLSESVIQSDGGTFSSISCEAPNSPQKRMAANAVDAISAMQLLYLRRCQGAALDDNNHWDSIVNVFAFPRPSKRYACCRVYYDNLFRCAQEGLRLLTTADEAVSFTAEVKARAFPSLAQLELAKYSVLSTPLHIALTAIPLVVGVEDAPWFLAQLKELFPLTELLRDQQRMALQELAKDQTVSTVMRETSEAVEDSPCFTLHHAVLFNCAWLAAFMAQSVTASTMTMLPMQRCSFPRVTQRTPTGSAMRDACSAACEVSCDSNRLATVIDAQGLVEDGSDDDQEAVHAAEQLFSSHLLSGGTDLSGGSSQTCMMSPRRDFILALLDQRKKFCYDQQASFDHLGAKVPSEMADLMTLMAGTALYLSNIARLSCMPSALMDSLLSSTLRRFIPVRNNLLDRRGRSEKKDLFVREVVNEIVERCRLLLRTTSFFDTMSDDHLYQFTPFIALGETASGSGDVVLGKAPLSASARWRWAYFCVRRLLLRHRAEAVSCTEMDLTNAIELVSAVAKSETVTVSVMRRLCHRRESLALYRLQGLEEMLRLIRREASSAETVGMLLSNEAGSRLNYKEGALNGCPHAIVVKIRRTMYDIVSWFTTHQRHCGKNYAHTSSELKNGASSETGKAQSSPASAAILCDVVNRAWAPLDFSFLCQLNLAVLFFKEYCSIFNAPDGTLIAEQPAECLHRELAKEHRTKSRGSNHTEDVQKDDDRESSVQRTSRERGLQTALTCLKGLALQCATALRPDLLCVQAAGCFLFLQQFFDVVNSELLLCAKYVASPLVSGTSAVVADTARVLEQVNLLCSLVSTVVRALAPSLVFNSSLSYAAAQLASTFSLTAESHLVLHHLGAPLLGSACVRTAALLLRHCSPIVANTCYEGDEFQQLCSRHATGWGEACSVLRFFYCLSVRCLCNTNAGEMSAHSIEALRELLSERRWASEMIHLEAPFLFDIKRCCDENAGPVDRVMYGIKVFVWMAVLGEGLLSLPSPGCRMRYTADDGRTMQEVFIVEQATGADAATALCTNRTDQTMYYHRANRVCDGVLDDTGSHETETTSGMPMMMTDEERQISHDALLTPSLLEATRPPPYKRLVENFLCPALEHFFRSGDRFECTALELACATRLLQVAYTVVRDRPEDCFKLVESQNIMQINLFASRCRAQWPLPFVYLKEYAAYVTVSLLQRCAIVITTGSDTLHALRNSTDSLGFSPCGNADLPLPIASLHPPGSVTRTDFRVSATNTSVPSSTSPTTAMLINVGRHLDGEVGALSTSLRSSPGRSAAIGTNVGTPLQHTYEEPVPTLCFYCTSEALPASVTITPIELGPSSTRQRAISFPTWTDGISIEMSLLLCNHLFPELGEGFSIPVAWSRLNMSFPLLSVYATEVGKPDVKILVLQAIVHAGGFICSIWPSHSYGRPIICQAPFADGEWGHFVHVAVIIDKKQCMLTVDGKPTIVPLPPAAADSLEQIFRTEGAVSHVVIGVAPPASDAHGSAPESEAELAVPEDRMLVLVSGIRICGMGQLKRSWKSMANLVFHDRCLPHFDAIENMCFFPLREFSGPVVQSTDGRFKGTLQGMVRWAACPCNSREPALSRVEKLYAGTRTEPPSFIPRQEVRALCSTFDAKGIEKLGCSLLWSLAAHLSRLTVSAALVQCTSPDYLLYREKQLHSAPTGSRANVFSPFLIFSQDGVASQLANLLCYNDSGSIPEEQLMMVKHINANIMEYLAYRPDELVKYLSDTATSMREHLLEEEIFHIKLPRHSYSSKDTPLVPLAFTNGGGGVLTFDPKFRGIEHVTIYKDREQKTILSKLPNGQGGWPDCVIPFDNPWIYVRLHSHTRSTASPTSPKFTVTIKSLKPIVMSSIFASIQHAFVNGDPRFSCGLPAFLNARMMASLTASSCCLSDGSFHAVRMLTSLMEVWLLNPSVQPFDRSPLHLALLCINVPLCRSLHHSSRVQEGSTLRWAALGTYNSFIQCLYGLLMAAIRLECAWHHVPYPKRVQHRWLRFGRLWCASTVSCANAPAEQPSECLLMPSAGTKGATVEGVSVSDCASVLTMQPPPTFDSLRKLPHAFVGLDVLLPPSPASPTPLIAQKGNGVWSVSCDRGTMTVRSNVGITRGRFYFEVRVLDATCDLIVGIATQFTKAFHAGDGLGQDAESWGFDCTCMCCVHNGYSHEFIMRAKWNPDEVVGVLIDMEEKMIVCIYDDLRVGEFDDFTRSFESPSPKALLSTERVYFPAVTCSSSGCEINFGAAPFVYTLRSGYLPLDPRLFCSPTSTRLWHLVTAVEWAKCLQEKPSTACSFLAGWCHAPVVDIKTRAKESPISHPALSLVEEYEEQFAVGRTGPLNVGLLSSSLRAKVGLSEVCAEDRACVATATVSVFSGKWYYEAIIQGDTAVSIGWASASVEAELGHGKVLGDDEYSWVLDTRRMIARHNKHQVSLSRPPRKERDVLGCLLDCNAGTISYTFNGVLQHPLHDTSGAEAAFRDVDMGEVGLTPVVALSAKGTITLVWQREDMAYLPDGFKPLGGNSVISDAIADYYLLHDASLMEVNSDASANGKATATPPIISFTPTSLEKVLRCISYTVDLSPARLSPYCLHGMNTDESDGEALGCPKVMAGGAAAIGLPKEDLRKILAVLEVFTYTAEVLFPYGHTGSLSVGSEGCTAESMSPLHSSLRELRRYCLPYLGLRALHRFLLATASPEENLKLTLHRRKAQATVKDTQAPIEDKLRDSLFGQVYQLLCGKSASLFCSNKKLWKVIFFGEGADDVGGPYRESLAHICTELMSSSLPLFIPSPNQVNELGESRDIYVVNPQLDPPVALGMYHFIGRLLGGCLRSSEPLSLYLPSVVWKELVGDAASASDLAQTDAGTLQALHYIHELAQGTGSVGLTPSLTPEREAEIDEELSELCPGGFTIQDDAGVYHELVHGGRNIQVTRRWADLYVHLALQKKCYGLTAVQLRSLKDGFHQVVPLCCISMLKWYELEKLVCGKQDFDPDALLDAARYDDLSPDDQRVLFLRQALRSFTQQQRAQFMRFISGRERLPPGMRLRLLPDDSFPSSHGVEQGLQPHTPPGGRTEPGMVPVLGRVSIRTAPAVGDALQLCDDERLPHSSTCFYWLWLPRYSSAEVLRQKLLYAIDQCLDIDADFLIHDEGLIENEPTLAVGVEDADDSFEDYSHLQ